MITKKYIKYLIEGLAYSFDDDTDKEGESVAYNMKKVYDAYDVLMSFNPDKTPSVSPDIPILRPDCSKCIDVSMTFNDSDDDKVMNKKWSKKIGSDLYVIYTISYIQYDSKQDYIQIELGRKGRVFDEDISIIFYLKDHTFSVEEIQSDVTYTDQKSFRKIFPEKIAVMLENIIKAFVPNVKFVNESVSYNIEDDSDDAQEDYKFPMRRFNDAREVLYYLGPDNVLKNIKVWETDKFLDDYYDSEISKQNYLKMFRRFIDDDHRYLWKFDKADNVYCINEICYAESESGQRFVEIEMTLNEDTLLGDTYYILYNLDSGEIFKLTLNSKYEKSIEVCDRISGIFEFPEFENALIDIINAFNPKRKVK